MKLLLLLPLLLGLPTPLFADSTSGYKKQNSCLIDDGDKKFILAKKEHSSSKIWGTYYCKDITNSTCWTYSMGSWISKGVSYDEANYGYELACKGKIF